MIGQLPTTLDINGLSYDIRSDFRNVLTIFEAFQDEELDEKDRLYILLSRIYVDVDSIPNESYTQAITAAIKFISGPSIGAQEKKNSPKVLSWVKDEALIFPAVNKVAGQQVRLCEYMHWWTFLGYFSTIDHDDLCAFVLMIRQKVAKGKNLEKHQREFMRSNSALFQVQNKPTVSAQDALTEMFNSLTQGGD